MTEQATATKSMSSLDELEELTQEILIDDKLVDRTEFTAANPLEGVIVEKDGKKRKHHGAPVFKRNGKSMEGYFPVEEVLDDSVGGQYQTVSTD